MPAICSEDCTVIFRPVRVRKGGCLPQTSTHLALSKDVALKTGGTRFTADFVGKFTKMPATTLKTVKNVAKRICGPSGIVLSAVRSADFVVENDCTVYTLAVFLKEQGIVFPKYLGGDGHKCEHLSPEEIRALRSGTEYETLDLATVCAFCCNQSLPPAPSAPAAEPWAIAVEVAPESVAIEMPGPTGCLPGLLCGRGVRTRKGGSTL